MAVFGLNGWFGSLFFRGGGEQAKLTEETSNREERRVPITPDSRSFLPLLPLRMHSTSAGYHPSFSPRSRAAASVLVAQLSRFAASVDSQSGPAASFAESTRVRHSADMPIASALSIPSRMAMAVASAQAFSVSYCGTALAGIAVMTKTIVHLDRGV